MYRLWSLWGGIKSNITSRGDMEKRRTSRWVQKSGVVIRAGNGVLNSFGVYV
jgi:hypothetical protein